MGQKGKEQQRRGGLIHQVILSYVRHAELKGLPLFFEMSEYCSLFQRIVNASVQDAVKVIYGSRFPTTCRS